MDKEKTALLTVEGDFDRLVLDSPLRRPPVPTVMLFSGGDVKRVLVGARSAQEYRAGIDELLH
jgi:hypothetical protein